MITSLPVKAISSYLQLARVQTAGLTLLTGIFGLIISSQGKPPFLQLIALALIGLAAHLHGFTFNEIADREIDGNSRYVLDKPLVRGLVSARQAWLLAWVPAFAAYFIIALIMPNLYLWLLFLLGHGAEKIYNVYGKKIPGLDIMLGIWAFTFCLFGAASINVSPLWNCNGFMRFPGPLPLLAFLIGALGGLQILFNNSVEGGIKDCENDRTVGAKTLAVVLGVRVEEQRLQVPRVFINYAWIVKGISLAIAMLAVITLPAGSRRISLLLLSLIALVIVVTQHRFLSNPRFDRNKLKRLFSVHEIFVYLMVPVLLALIAGPTMAIILVVFPIAWFVSSNRLLYGTWLNPKV